MGVGMWTLKLFRAAVALMLFLGPSAGKATTYTIENPLGSVGDIWFPAFTTANLANGGVGGISGMIVTDGTLGTLTAQNIVSFQLTVNALMPPNGVSSDVSMPLPGTGTVSIAGTAFFATPTGLFFNFESASSSYVKFERDSTSLGQADTFFCLNAGGASCGGASQFDVTAAVLFPTNPGESVFIGKSNSDLLNSSNPTDIVSDAGVFQFAEGALGVPASVVGTGIPGLATLLLGWLMRRRAHVSV
jgi:hypothetical protein